MSYPDEWNQKVKKMSPQFQDDYWAARRKLRRELNHVMLWGDEKEQAEMVRTTSAKPNIQFIAGRHHMNLGLIEHQRMVQAAIDEEYDEARSVKVETKYFPHGENGTVFVVTEITSFDIPGTLG